jgi:hypothetical protein
VATYSSQRDNVTATNPIITTLSPANGQIALAAFRWGLATTSTTISGGRHFWQRSTGGATPTSIVEEEHNTRSPANATDTVTWGTGTSLAGNPYFVLCGIRQQLVAEWHPPRPWAAIHMINGEQGDLRETLTSSSLSLSEHIVEDPFPNYATRRTRRPRRAGLWSYLSHEVNYTHKTGTGAYDLHRANTHNYVDRVRMVRPLPAANAWPAYYGTAAPPADHIPFQNLAVRPEFPYYAEV